MKIYVVGSSNNKFAKLDNIREKFLVDVNHKGDNIDFLNKWYCELTGLYYLWKNTTDDIIGLEHYRRYFVSQNSMTKKFKLITEDQIKDILKDYDVICKKWDFQLHGEKLNGLTFWERGKIVDRLYYLISKLNDKEFANYFIGVLEHQKYFAQCNMFIAKRPVINEYCSWLFNIFTKMRPHEFKQWPRIHGYYSEFMFGAWLQYKGYKIKYQDAICLDKDITKTIEYSKGE